MSSFASNQYCDTVLSQVGHKGWTFLAWMDLPLLQHPRAPTCTPYGKQCVEGRYIVNMERVQYYSKNAMITGKSCLEDVFCVYAVKIWKTNLTWPESTLLSTFSLIILGKSCVYGLCQWSAITTFERIIRNHFLGSMMDDAVSWVMKQPALNKWY